MAGNGGLDAVRRIHPGTHVIVEAHCATRLKDEIARLGGEIHERDVPAQVETDRHGEIVSMDLEAVTGPSETAPLKQWNSWGRNVQRLLTFDLCELVIERCTAGDGLPAADGVIRERGKRGLRRPVGAGPGNTCLHWMDNLLPSSPDLSPRSSGSAVPGVHAVQELTA